MVHLGRKAAILALLACLASSATAQTTPPPRLAGVLVAPGGRVAILAHDADGSSFVAVEGDSDGAYRVQSIAADSVTLAGPDGLLTLHLQDRFGRGMADTARPGASAAEIGSVASGLRSGRAAVHYDSCVDRGLLPRSGVPATVKLGRVVDAMADLPRRTGEDWRLDPPRDMAMWTRLGLHEAEREPRTEPTPATCQSAAADWTGAARRFGVP